ncbi:MAG: NAD-binding protein, partial [Pseudomonadales bacterium]
MKYSESNPIRRVDWHWWVAALLFLCAMSGFLSGVSVSEREHVSSAGVLTKAYYSLGLFVLGGLDLGTPSGGPLLGRVLLWLAYFGSPILTVSAVIETLLHVLAPHSWHLRHLRGHIVICGAGGLTITFLRKLRATCPRLPVVVVDQEMNESTLDELQQIYRVRYLIGDFTSEFVLSRLRLERARRVLFLSNDNYKNYEAASIVLKLFPELRNSVIIRSSDLRFMRVMADTRAAHGATTFNAYHVAAAGLVKSSMLDHFRKTVPRDTVVIAGFGRFGQTILEELHHHAQGAFDKVAIIDRDAQRRVLVADEELDRGGGYQREVFEGEIQHPKVWQQLAKRIQLEKGEPVIIVGTGDDEQNLRTAVWLRKKYPYAKILSRSLFRSSFADEVGNDQSITTFSIAQLLEDNIPDAWVGGV